MAIVNVSSLWSLDHADNSHCETKVAWRRLLQGWTKQEVGGKLVCKERFLMSLEPGVPLGRPGLQTISSKSHLRQLGRWEFLLVIPLLLLPSPNSRSGPCPGGFQQASTKNSVPQSVGRSPDELARRPPEAAAEGKERRGEARKRGRPRSRLSALARARSNCLCSR